MSKDEYGGTLYAVTVAGKPVAIMCVGAMPAFPDEFITKPELVKATRAIHDFEAQIGSEARELGDIREITEAMETYLGEDLIAAGLWDGESTSWSLRAAESAEIDQWKASYEDAVRIGEQEAGDHDWVVILR